MEHLYRLADEELVNSVAVPGEPGSVEPNGLDRLRHAALRASHRVLPEEGLHRVRLLGGQEPLRHGLGQLSQQKARLVPGRIEI